VTANMSDLYFNAEIFLIMHYPNLFPLIRFTAQAKFMSMQA